MNNNYHIEMFYNKLEDSYKAEINEVQESLKTAYDPLNYVSIEIDKFNRTEHRSYILDAFKSTFTLVERQFTDLEIYLATLSKDWFKVLDKKYFQKLESIRYKLM